MLGGHEWKQNVLELKSQWLEDEEASGLAPRGPGTARPLSSVELFAPAAPAILLGPLTVRSDPWGGGGPSHKRLGARTHHPPAEDCSAFFL